MAVQQRGLDPTVGKDRVCHLLLCALHQDMFVFFPLDLAPRCLFCPQAKVEMLDNLLDIEVAYSLLRGGSDDSSKDPIDVNYEKLKTDIKVRRLPLPQDSVFTQEQWSPAYMCSGAILIAPYICSEAMILPSDLCGWR